MSGLGAAGADLGTEGGGDDLEARGDAERIHGSGRVRAYGDLYGQVSRTDNGHLLHQGVAAAEADGGLAVDEIRVGPDDIDGVGGSGGEGVWSHRDGWESAGIVGIRKRGLQEQRTLAIGIECGHAGG